MKKQGLPVYVLSVTILISAVLVSWALLSGPSAPPPTATPSAQQDDYRLGKLDEVNDMVLAREVVPEDYLRYLPEDIREPIQQYNADTAVLKSNYSGAAEGIVESLFYSFDPPPDDPGGYLRPERYYQMVDRISTLALYRNSNEFFHMDSVVSYPAAHEGGGSYGLWAWAIHEDWYVGDDLAGQAKDYFTMIDALLDKLDAARAGLTTNP